ncbi:hypothetical protein [Haloarchaeobius sp. HME9146]|uniref:hypothetical protein n=1 Tax=Haloarchaeobius sp. HME9146 TaxID=2978732 RepID=UPI0021C1F25D|nr:hypothetical protein [Haloarchaeobius sp. HME9146]MCT9097880.1 hypothetical protein [Haloarchaeobius sp. HME9146]
MSTQRASQSEEPLPTVLIALALTGVVAAGFVLLGGTPEAGYAPPITTNVGTLSLGLLAPLILPFGLLVDELRDRH